MIDLLDATAAGPALPTPEAWAALEHRHGVLPLVAAFFVASPALAEMVSGRVRGALGFFTPTPEPGWEAAAVAGEPSGGGVLLRGSVRLPGPSADGSIVLARLGEAEHRLAWLDHGAPGVERRGSRTGGAVGDGPCWLRLDGVTVGLALVSRPVTLAPGGELSRLLVAYAGVWAAAAADCAREGVRALRRAARLAAFQGSQQVALGITGVEIEADLTAAAVRHHAGDIGDIGDIGDVGDIGDIGDVGDIGGLAVAVAAARTLRAVATITEELRDAYGLEIDGPLAGDAARTLTSFLGGSLLLENELARALGIGEAQGG